MNPAHLHLLLNHTPILGSLAGLLILLAGVVRGNSSVTKTGLITLVVAALLAIPTLLTGDPAEEVVEHRPGVTRGLIHEHEEAAELAFWALELTGALALASLVLGRGETRPASRLLTTKLALAGAFISFGLMARAGNLGGQIMHPEARPDFVAPTEEHEARPPRD